MSELPEAPEQRTAPRTLRSGEVRAQGTEVLEGLRVFGANYTEFTRRFAVHLGLHSTDATALTEILYAEDQGVPLSPARLAERLSLTSGATTSLVNRLEAAGHVVRSRESADRRIVTLRSSPDIRRPAGEFFAPLGAAIEAMVAEYPADRIAEFERFLAHLRRTMEQLLDD